MTRSQAEKAKTLTELHAGPETFVIGNAFDASSARLLTAAGFKALATSSAVHAAAVGKVDGQCSRDEALAHAKLIVDATDLPVSADLENGFGDDPADVSETIRAAAAIGLAGGSIEDASGDADAPIYPFEHAVARIEAAVAAAAELDCKFSLTARTENFVRGIDDLDDTIARLQAFEAAGADVLMAPGLPHLDAVKRVCDAVSKPVSFMVGIPGRSFSVTELAAAGVRRISLATSLYSVAMAATLEAAREILQEGTFNHVDRTLSGDDWGLLLNR